MAVVMVVVDCAWSYHLPCQSCPTVTVAWPQNLLCNDLKVNYRQKNWDAGMLCGAVSWAPLDGSEWRRRQVDRRRLMRPETCIDGRPRPPSSTPAEMP